MIQGSRRYLRPDAVARIARLELRARSVVEGVLAPGDMLFLPKSVWHYVRSLTTSVSVNFWF